jgi:hypothetical protein
VVSYRCRHYAGRLRLNALSSAKDDTSHDSPVAVEFDHIQGSRRVQMGGKSTDLHTRICDSAPGSQVVG